MTAVQESTAPADTIELENVVASSGIDRELDLQRVAADLEGVEYNPDRFRSEERRVGKECRL